MHRSVLTPRAGRLVAVSILALSILAPTGGPAVAGPPAPERVAPGPVTPPPLGVSRQAAAPLPRPSQAWPTLGLRPAEPGRSGVQVGSTCTPWLFAGGTGITYDQFLEEVVGVSYNGGVDCDFSLLSISGEVGVVDRSPAFNGQFFNGVWLGSSGMFGFGYSASTSGGIVIRARQYNGGRSFEPVISLTLAAPGGIVWDFCGLVPGLFYYACDGLGTSVLHVEMGGFVRPSGLTQACRDQNAGVDNEQKRLVEPIGSTPASTQVLGLITSLRDRVIAFKQALCSTTSAGASGFATSQGQQLWDTAVTAAKNPATNRDDRPLYWARLSMTAALNQWRPVFGVDRSALQRTLDQAARGMNSHDFTLGTTKKVFVSGFDPFLLDGGYLFRGNPSASAVLALDNTILAGAEIQVVIFPVRYADFETIPPTLGIVETAVAQHLATGPQRATMITTVSQGGSSFELEYWNGRSRSTDAPDNLKMASGGTYLSPVVPGYLAGMTKQFARSTLPFEAMLTGSPFAVCVDPSLVEQSARGVTPVSRSPLLTCDQTQTSVPPPAVGTPGWLAVEGGGGGYLSNEVAYRVTEMRDYFGSTVKAGHVHVPILNFSPPGLNDQSVINRRRDIADQYRQILIAGIGAA